MATKKYVYVPKEDYSINDDIVVYYELDFYGDTIKPKDLIRFKRVRGKYRFRFWAHNIKLDSTWIDCVDVSTGEFKSFRIDKLKGVIRPKKSRRKKI